jgi:hypothetical protein
VSTVVSVQKPTQTVATPEHGSQLRSLSSTLRFDTALEANTEDRMLPSIPSTSGLHMGFGSEEDSDNDDKALQFGAGDKEMRDSTKLPLPLLAQDISDDDFQTLPLKGRRSGDVVIRNPTRHDDIGQEPGIRSEEVFKERYEKRITKQGKHSEPDPSTSKYKKPHKAS